MMPRQRTVSPSKLSTFLACPVKYIWTYVDGRGRKYFRTSRQYSFGNTLHSVLESFHESGQSGVPTVEEVMTTYEENWISAGYTSADEMAEAFGEGQEILATYLADEERQKELSGANTIAVEKTLNKVYEDFRLTGRLDRLDRHPDGTLEVIDYKTQRSVSEEIVANDLAMSMYQLLLRHNYPEHPRRATLISLRDGQRASATLSDEALDQLEADILISAHWMKDPSLEEYEPKLKPMCANCEFLPLCKRHPDFREAFLEASPTEVG